MVAPTTLTFSIAAAVLASTAAVLGMWYGLLRPDKFTDVVNVSPSPDGRLQAALVVDSHGPMAGTFFGVTLSPVGADPLKGEPVISTNEPSFSPDLRWPSDSELSMVLPCGEWGGLTNFYELPGTDRAIRITHRSPENCGTM